MNIRGSKLMASALLMAAAFEASGTQFASPKEERVIRSRKKTALSKKQQKARAATKRQKSRKR